MTVSRKSLRNARLPQRQYPARPDVLILGFPAPWPFSLWLAGKTEDLEYFYPTDVLVTGYDIIFFWVARMIFSGMEHMKSIPSTRC